MAARPVPAPPPDLGAEIDAHRIYFEVQRETAQYGDARITVALQVWVWATVAKRAGSLPGEPGCLRAVAALHAAAQAAVASGDVTPPPDVEPFRWRLYASRRVPDADELRLELSLRAPPGVAGPEQSARERALASLRRALEAVGVFEGSWRPSPRRLATPPAKDAWEARPAREALGRARLVPAPA